VHDQPICRIPFDQLHSIGGRAFQPLLKLMGLQYRHHALFFIGLVQVLHQVVPICVHREHRVALHPTLC
jgi:hypothetical protein